MAEPRTSSGPELELYQGDCLEVLPKLAERERRFRLVYSDPPYNAGGARGARIGKGERQYGEVAYRDQWGGLDGFLSMMRPRIERIRDLMSDDGTFWLHLDHRAVHDAKVLTDSIFGRRAFQGEVIWVPGNGGRKRSGLAVTHQTILVYSKSDDYFFDTESEALREPFAETSLGMHFKKTDADGRSYRERTINGKTYRYYADRGRRLGSVWSDIPSMQANTPLRSEATGYPTQKPVLLLERIVRAATKEGDWVLDPMCGSGTTLAAARNLGRSAVGIDEGKIAIDVCAKRLELSPRVVERSA